MQRKTFFSFIGSVVLCLSVSGVYSQGINGRVLDESGQAIRYATIFSLPDSLYTISDSSGYFLSFSNHFIVRALGFRSKQVVDFKKGTVVFMEEDPVFLDNVVVNDLAIAEQIQSFPGSIDRISISQIERTNPAIVTDALNSIPGVYMQSGALNTNRIVIRGIGSRSPFSTNKIRAYYDDIPLTNGSGETTIEDIDLAGIGSIEVIKGPNSSIYGSGLGGTINIKSRKPVLLQDRVFTDLSLGSFATQKSTIGFSTSRERFNVNVVGSYLQSDGYRDNNELTRGNVMLRSKYYMDKTTFGFIGYFVDQKAFIPSSVNLETFESDPSAAAFTWGSARGFEDYYSYLVGLSLDHAASDRLLIKSSVYHSNRDAYEPRPFNILDDQTISFGTRNRLIYDAQDNLTLMAGFELFKDEYSWSTFDNLYNDLGVNRSVQGQQLSELVEDRSYVNAFFQGDWQATTSLMFSAGLNVNQTAYDLFDAYNPDSLSLTSDFLYDLQWSPRIAFTFTASPALNWYGSVSHGFSPPSLEETLTPDGAVNTDIVPESGWNFETGLKGGLSFMNYSVSIYTMRIDDLLVARRTALDQFAGINAGSTIHNGLELSTTTRLLERGAFRLYHAVQYTHANYIFDDFIDDEDDFSGNELTGVPKNQLRMNLSMDWKNIYLTPSYFFVDEIPLNDSNSEFADAYSLLDVLVGWKKEMGDLLLDISYQGSNLTDARYASMVQINAVGFGGNLPRYYYPGLPINHRIRLRLSYSLNQR